MDGLVGFTFGFAVGAAKGLNEGWCPNILNKFKLATVGARDGMTEGTDGATLGITDGGRRGRVVGDFVTI